MPPLARVVRLQQGAQQRIAKTLLCPRRCIHANTARLSAEAAPTSRPAHYDKTRRGSSVIDEILLRRAKAGRLVAGVAAPSDSDMFKGDVSDMSWPF